MFAKLGDAVVPESFDVAPPDTIAGWCGGRHLLDRTFDADNLFGDAVLMGFRLDAFKLPADLRRAWQLQNEEALSAAEPGSSKSAIRKAAREEVDDRARREMTSGLHRSSRMFPVLWDRAGGVLLAPTPSDAARTALVDLARLTLDLELEPESAGVFAESFAASRGVLRDLEDATPTSFGPPPRGHEGGQVPIPMISWARSSCSICGAVPSVVPKTRWRPPSLRLWTCAAPGKRVGIKGCVPTLQLARQRHARG